MNDPFEQEMRRRFATQDPVPADEAFVVRLRGELLRRRRLQRVGAISAIILLGVLVAFTLSRLAPLFELVSRGASALGGLAVEAPSSLPALAILGALIFAAAVVTWALRRI
jgi:hypothetical protein